MRPILAALAVPTSPLVGTASGTGGCSWMTPLISRRDAILNAPSRLAAATTAAAATDEFTSSSAPIDSKKTRYSPPSATSARDYEGEGEGHSWLPQNEEEYAPPAVPTSSSKMRQHPWDFEDESNEKPGWWRRMRRNRLNSSDDEDSDDENGDDNFVYDDVSSLSSNDSREGEEKEEDDDRRPSLVDNHDDDVSSSSSISSSDSTTISYGLR